jgi:hypothetical protein
MKRSSPERSVKMARPSGRKAPGLVQAAHQGFDLEAGFLGGEILAADVGHCPAPLAVHDSAANTQIGGHLRHLVREQERGEFVIGRIRQAVA